MAETAKTIFAGLGIWFLVSLVFVALVAFFSSRFRKNQRSSGKREGLE